MSADQTGEADPDFDAAAQYVEMARKAHAAGEKDQCSAALRMVAVALNLTDVGAPKFHLKHLKAS